MSGFLDNELTLKNIYNESPEYIIAQRFKSMYDEIDSLHCAVNDSTERLLTVSEEHSKKLIETIESHKVTVGYYQRQLEQYKKELRDARQLNDSLLKQQVDNIKASVLVVYKLSIDDIMNIFDLELRGGSIAKNTESLKFIETACEDAQMPLTLYYVSDGQDRRFVDSYYNTYTTVPGFMTAWSETGRVRTVDVGPKKMTFAMIAVSGGKSILSFDDPCKLFSPSFREKIISGLTSSSSTSSTK
jgi:hypothetical protein